MTESREEESEIRGAIPTYYGFIIDKLNRIYDAWDKGDWELALTRALKLVPFLPVKLKKQLREKKLKIQEMLKNSRKISGYNFYSVSRLTAKSVNHIANTVLEDFIDTVTDLLDKEHLLIQQYGVPTRQRNIQQLGEALR